MATHSQQYVSPTYQTAASVSESETLFAQNVTTQLEALQAQIASLSMVPQMAQIPQPGSAIHQQVAAVSDNCGVYGHLGYECSSTVEQVAAFQHYRNSFNNDGWKPYNQAGNSSGAPYVPPHRNNPPYQKPVAQEPPVGNPNYNQFNELKVMMLGMQRSQEALISQVAKLDQDKNGAQAALKNLETQIAQIAASQASRQPGHLPSQPTKPTYTANAITLRSGTSYDGPAMPTNNMVLVEDETELEAEEKKNSRPASS
jgi:hypothetical protein